MTLSFVTAVSLDLPHLPFGLYTRGILATFEERPDELRYLLLGSRTPGVFNLGGDLDHFAARMRVRDRQALVA
jgi:DSF synthase